MIADNLNNIDIYKNISPDIYEGLKFLQNVKSDIQPGEYKINNYVKALVAEYETKEIFEKGYEAHKRAIDIHYPVTGVEKIKWSPLQGMTCHIDYNIEEDMAFYKDPSQLSHVIVGNGTFAIFFPEDAHGPQHYVNKPETITKIVMKISI